MVKPTKTETEIDNAAYYDQKSTEKNVQTVLIQPPTLGSMRNNNERKILLIPSIQSIQAMQSFNPMIAPPLPNLIVTNDKPSAMSVSSEKCLKKYENKIEISVQLPPPRTATEIQASPPPHRATKIVIKPAAAATISKANNVEKSNSNNTNDIESKTLRIPFKNDSNSERCKSRQRSQHDANEMIRNNIVTQHVESKEKQMQNQKKR